VRASDRWDADRFFERLNVDGPPRSAFGIGKEKAQRSEVFYLRLVVLVVDRSTIGVDGMETGWTQCQARGVAGTSWTDTAAMISELFG
jgi:hypothetical protein